MAHAWYPPLETIRANNGGGVGLVEGVVVGMDFGVFVGLVDALIVGLFVTIGTAVGEDGCNGGSASSFFLLSENAKIANVADVVVMQIKNSATTATAYCSSILLAKSSFMRFWWWLYWYMHILNKVTKGLS